MIIQTRTLVPYSLAGLVLTIVVGLVVIDVRIAYENPAIGHPLPNPTPASQAAPQRHVIPTEYRRDRHTVEAVLIGPSGKPVRVPLILDTGATSIALPASLKAKLGFDDRNLENGRARTAGGIVPSETGHLLSASVGTAKAGNILVTFIKDRTFGRSDEGLLGMSFLKHFEMTVTDDPARIILASRGSGSG